MNTNNSDIDSLKEEFDFYLKNKDSFIKKYTGQFIALKARQVIYSNTSKENVITYMITHGHKMGSFLIQFVSSGDEETIQRYYSRVYC